MPNWVKSTEFYTNSEGSYHPMVVFFNSYNNPAQYPNLPVGMALNTFVPVDLKPYGVPADAKYALLGGTFLMTGAANITVATRIPGDSSITLNHYDEQCLGVDPAGGQRSVYFNNVALVDGTFEFGMAAQRYPNNGQGFFQGQIPAVGINLKLKGWGK